MSSDGKSIREELEAATGVTHTKGEKRSFYLERLSKAARRLEDPTWEALSKATQDWVFDAKDDLEAGKPVREFPSTEKAGAPEAKASDEGDRKESTEVSKTKKAKVAKKKAPKASEPKTEKVEAKAAPKASAAKGKTKSKAKSAKGNGNGGLKTTGRTKRIAELMIAGDWKVPANDLMAKLEKEHYAISIHTVRAARQTAIIVRDAMAEKGLLKSHA